MIHLPKVDTSRFKIEANRKFLQGLDEALDKDGVHELLVKVRYEHGVGNRFVVVDKSYYGKSEVLEIGDKSSISRPEPVDLSEITVNLRYFDNTKKFGRKYLEDEGYGSAFRHG